MSGYPAPPVEINDSQPVPRRIRGTIGDTTIFDTQDARYVWEWPYYPQYYIPVDHIDPSLLVDDGEVLSSGSGPARAFSLRVGDQVRPHAVRVYASNAVWSRAGMARFDWDALDAWYEEDERVFVHPRNPYSRADALRSTRHVRVELDGVLLAESHSPVMLFETGLPTRYYLNRSEVHLSRLRPSSTTTSCPYKGTTSAYWAAVTGRNADGEDEVSDIAWSYDFPTAGLSVIAGMVAFLNEKVDVIIDGTRLDRPSTHFG
jgi:uncharacterized protein (DUF427 family)